MVGLNDTYLQLTQCGIDDKRGFCEINDSNPLCILPEDMQSAASAMKRRDRKITDETLVKRAKRGDDSAFGQLMKRYQSRIYRLARRMTETDEDAEDVVQEAFVKAFRSLRGFKEESRFSTWLYRITVNLALMKLRRHRPELVSLDQPISTSEGMMQRELEDEGTDPLERLLERESAEILDAAVEALPPTYRAVFVLRHVEGLSTEETAKILGISVPAVKSRLHRTRIMLQQKLFEYLRSQTKGR